LHSRYSLIYYWYTLFYLNEKNGKPPMLPLWAEFPTDSNIFAIDDQHLVGQFFLNINISSFFLIF
jgi:alpha-glucosidase (family GH31 glycosyl hydrolase)